MRPVLLLLPALSACTGSDGDPDPGASPDPDPGPGPGSPVETDPYATVVPNFPTTDQDFEGHRLTTSIPDEVRGLLFVFHGTNGDVPSVIQTEWIVLYNLLVPQGVGLAITDALDPELAQWDHTDDPTNPDFQRLSRIRDHLIATTPVEADTPILAIGFSAGGRFASVFTALGADAGWDVRGFASHQSSFLGRVAVPGFFVSAENDEESGTPDEMGPLAEICSLEAGEPCPHRMGHEIPLHPLRFARLTAYDEQQSRTLFDEMVSMGLVDADGIRLVDLETRHVDDVMEEYIRTSEGPSPSLPPTQLRVVWATHRFSGEHAVDEAAWLLDRLDR